MSVGRATLERIEDAVCDGCHTTAEVQAKVGCSRTTAEKGLLCLVEEGAIGRAGHGHSTRYAANQHHAEQLVAELRAAARERDILRKRARRAEARTAVAEEHLGVRRALWVAQLEDRGMANKQTVAKARAMTTGAQFRALIEGGSR